MIKIYLELLKTAVEDNRTSEWYDKIISHIDEDIEKLDKEKNRLLILKKHALEMKGNI